MSEGFPAPSFIPTGASSLNAVIELVCQMHMVRDLVPYDKLSS